MTKLTVKAGSCGFATAVAAEKGEKRTVRVSLESDCENIQALNQALEALGPLKLAQIMGTGEAKNPVIREVNKIIPHSACPLLTGILKACEVELGLNIPSDVTLEFIKEDSANA